jgi:hypothetical protein
MNPSVRLSVLSTNCARSSAIVGIAAGQLQPVVGAARDPVVQILIGEPAPPAYLQHLVEIELVDSGDDK